MLVDYNTQELVHLRSTNLFMADSPSEFHDSHNCMGDGVQGKAISQGSGRDQGLLSSLQYNITVGG